PDCPADIESQPDNLAARLALAENYEKKGDLQKAIRVCKDVLERDPGNKAAKKYLVRLYHVGGQDAEALDLALALIDESLQQKDNFRCKVCGHESDELFWRCPVCHEWETASKN
ncbi:MAG: tetratricopeptide repeat protein, partial [Calditrichaeota bacterium]